MARPWLKTLLESEFFTRCTKHDEEGENNKKTRTNELKILCTDCCTSVCSLCLPPHENHHYLRIWKNRTYASVDKKDLQRLFHSDGIQTHEFRGKDLVYIKMEPLKKNRKVRDDGGYCRTCARSISDKEKLFCSIACKPIQRKKPRKQRRPSRAPFF